MKKEKSCSFCKQTLSLDKFYFSIKDSRYSSRCRECNIKRGRRKVYTPAERRDLNLRKLYRISSKDWDDMFKNQNFMCAICRTKTGTDAPFGGWCTDHNHATGKVRGILCNSCNSLLGHAKDNPEILFGAMEYLVKDPHTFSRYCERPAEDGPAC